MQENVDSHILPVPPNINIVETAQSMTIEYKWFKVMFVILLVFAMIWDMFIAVFYVMLLQENELPTFVLFVPSLHLLVGVGLTYYAIAGLFNKTVIQVERDFVQIKHAPLPWLGAIKVDRRDIKQLFVVQKQRRGKNGISIAYNVNLVTKDLQSIKLVSGFEEVSQARFVERKIEEFYKIENKPVDGEWS